MKRVAVIGSGGAGMIRVTLWIAAAVVVAGCVSPTISGCPAIAPSALPDGTAPLQARTTRDQTGAEIAIWGTGANEVRQAARKLDPGEAAACAGRTVIFARDCYPLDPPVLQVRGRAAVMFTVGDDLDEYQFDWVENGCVYEVRLPTQMLSQAAIDYAGRY